MKSQPDPGLRGPERRRRPGHRVLRQGPDRQGHVGHDRTGWPTWSSRRSASPAYATTAWVPSPTAATLHAMHYHYVDVYAVHKELAGKTRGTIDALLTIPLTAELAWSPEEIHERSTTTASRSSATWCAGSTRASAAPGARHPRRRPDGKTVQHFGSGASCWRTGCATASPKTTSRPAGGWRRWSTSRTRRTRTSRRWRRTRTTASRSRRPRTSSWPARRSPGYTEPILHRRRSRVHCRHRRLTRHPATFRPDERGQGTRRAGTYPGPGEAFGEPG